LGISPAKNPLGSHNDIQKKLPVCFWCWGKTIHFKISGFCINPGLKNISQMCNNLGNSQSPRITWK
jgi:hypothetical protein